jgi:hypothetical protein
MVSAAIWHMCGTAGSVRYVGMGNGRARRRGAPRRHTAGRDRLSGFEPLTHNMWTVEGQIEQTGRFARMVNQSTGWRRWAGKAMLTFPLWVMLGSGLVVLIAWLVKLAI